ncbi:hypothetical protein [uncultured Sphingomonas sp.]|uniref:hypothetical protein n=1 Tax=uncultured Sphingomonas sp. TaxID=158754 RepID=UPI0035C9FB6D
MPCDRRSHDYRFLAGRFRVRGMANANLRERACAETPSMSRPAIGQRATGNAALPISSVTAAIEGG